MNLKDLVKKYRTGKKWQQRDLAAKVGVSQNYISKIELGQAVPRSERFRDRLTAALSIPKVQMLEAYAESKLSSEEAAAFRKVAFRGFKDKPRGELLTAEEEALLRHFQKLGQREKKEVLEFVGFKLRRHGDEANGS
ncbi:MAG: helix-turn-helix domain-containing protein [Candidatus Wallbacteria bacterium]|nr:helix-turn-helix domain-containing protein [Candidatus Wallbacteria bacterium]